MKIIEVEKKPLFFEEEKLTPKESKYRSAKKLQEAVDCVERFEHAVASLESAQLLYEELDDYKDSAQRAQECAALAQKMHADGLEDAYQNAVKMMDEATDKLAYRTVISEFERFPDYKDSAERIGSCKGKLKRIATMQVWKNRALAVLVAAAAVGIFWISPAKPYARGMIHLRQGKYSQALREFKQCETFLDSKWQKKKCRFRQAQKAYQAGDIDRALSLCLLARGRGDADDFMAELTVERMKEAKPGDTVLFGAERIAGREKRIKENLPEGTGGAGLAAGEAGISIQAGGLCMTPWVVAKRDQDVLTLVNLAGGYRGIYDRETNDWPQSRLRNWLNRKLKDQLFSGGERRLLQPVANGNPERPDKVYILGREDFDLIDLTRRSFLPFKDGDRRGCWLRDAGDGRDKAYCVDSESFVRCAEDVSFYVTDLRDIFQAPITEKMDIYPVVKVSLDQSLVEGSPSPAPTQDAR